MSDKFSVAYKLLPPRLQMQIWVLGLDADTSRVGIAYRAGCFRTSLAYDYGGKLEAALGNCTVTTSVGFNPQNRNVEMGLVFQGFRFGGTVDPALRSGGLTLSYGAGLLPFPDELSSTFNSAAHGLQTMAGDIQAAPNNPLAWYRLHSNDAATIGKAIKTVQQIAASDKFPVSAGMRLNYDPKAGLTITIGVGGRF